WIAAHDAVYHLGSTRAQVQRAWSRARAMHGAHPIARPTGPMISPDQFDDTFLVGGYTNAVWPGLAVPLAAYLRQHHNGPMVSAYKTLGAQNENENLFAVYNAVQCSDVNWPRNWAKWDADTRR